MRSAFSARTAMCAKAGAAQAARAREGAADARAAALCTSLA